MIIPDIDYSIHHISLEVRLPSGFMSTTNMEKEVPKLLRRIVTKGKNFWHSEAGRRLKSTRRLYQDALYTRPANAELGLSGGFLPFAVEHGTGPFDMKPGFLAGGSPRNIPLNVNRNEVFRYPQHFARVGAASKSDSWVHPGFKAANIRDAVLNELQNTIIPAEVAVFVKAGI